MDTYTAPQIKASQFTPPRPIDEYSEEAKKNIAVLFTDIVGYSNFLNPMVTQPVVKCLGSIRRWLLRLLLNMAA